jgi:hypothetical protein
MKANNVSQGALLAIMMIALSLVLAWRDGSASSIEICRPVSPWS